MYAKLFPAVTLGICLVMCISIASKGDEPQKTKENTAMKVVFEKQELAIASGLTIIFSPQLLDKRIPTPLIPVVPVPKIPIPPPTATTTIAAGTAGDAVAFSAAHGNWIVRNGKWAFRIGGRLFFWASVAMLVWEGGNWIFENGEWLWQSNRPSSEPLPSDNPPPVARGTLLARTPKDPASWEKMTPELIKIDEQMRYIAFRFHTGWMCADPVQNVVVADRQQRGPWETFQIIHNNDGTISFKAHANGKYVCAEGGGPGKLGVDRTRIGEWEKFIPLKAGDEKIYLVTSGGWYLCAESGL
jgi:hypothetical protein